jgi:transcriptional regulator with XRE-family HTH domain
MSHAQLGRIERGLQPYNQALLEGLAKLYETSVASLIERVPEEEAFLALWGQAGDDDKRETTNFLEFRVKSRP